MLTVVDLFCGAGGISEGFRQAGCSVLLGIDKDRWAVETFRRNLKSTSDQRDLVTYPLDQLPSCDVLVGGPPCIEFSSSNRGGNGNILEGMELVQTFLRAVYVLRPRWWIMENVPRITEFLPDDVPLRWIGIDSEGVLPVPQRCMFNSADYGAPQARQRFLMGHYPVPAPTHQDPDREPLLTVIDGRLPWRTLGQAISSLPDPLHPTTSADVTDFNYGISIPVTDLTSHFYDTVLDPDQIRRIRQQKLLHPFYGMLAFPDPLDRPARTVVATQMGRETLVVCGVRDDEPVYRRATIRECAVLQTFPITYQWFGGSLGTRYRLVGDAVPPKLSFAIASEIMKMDRGLAGTPVLQTTVVDRAPELTPAIRQSASRRGRWPALDRRFREMVPGKEVRGCRVDLDNRGQSLVPHPIDGGHHLCEWVARVYLGEGRAMRNHVVRVSQALEQLIVYGSDRVRCDLIHDFLVDLDARLYGVVPDASSLQAIWCGEIDYPIGPYEVTELLSRLVDQHFPRSQYADTRLRDARIISDYPRKGMRLRIVAGMLATAVACELANLDATWANAHPQDRWRSGRRRNHRLGGTMGSLRLLDRFADRLRLVTV